MPITLYRHQFTQLGVYGMGPFAFSERPLPVTGKDVPVAIFDTSPFSLPDNVPSLQSIHGTSISVTHMTLPISTGLTSTWLFLGMARLWRASFRHWPRMQSCTSTACWAMMALAPRAH